MKLQDVPEIMQAIKDNDFNDFADMLRSWPGISDDTLFFCLEIHSSDDEHYLYCGPLKDGTALEDTFRIDEYLERIMKELELTETVVEIGAAENLHIIYGWSSEKIHHIAGLIKQRLLKDFKLYIDPDSDIQ